MARVDVMDLINQAMFDPQKEQELSPSDRVLLSRIKSTYALWLDKPFLSDKNIRDYLITNYNISKMQALRDLQNIRILLGNVKNASVEFYRYKINDLLDRAAQAAINGDDSKAKALAKVADIMVKNNRTDASDEDKPDYSKIEIPDWSFSINPIHAGVKLSESAIKKGKELKRQLLGDIEDIDYECSANEISK